MSRTRSVRRWRPGSRWQSRVGGMVATFSASAAASRICATSGSRSWLSRPSFGTAAASTTAPAPRTRRSWTRASATRSCSATSSTMRTSWACASCSRSTSTTLAAGASSTSQTSARSGSCNVSPTWRMRTGIRAGAIPFRRRSVASSLGVTSCTSLFGTRVSSRGAAPAAFTTRTASPSTASGPTTPTRRPCRAGICGWTTRANSSSSLTPWTLASSRCTRT
mmetsp:Transcript_117505/g.339719  ORF Transcript_117505/g.339719 Transcript_117505/m.339719 type:complete len:222 (+) Transcript_117505:559-1224(+)